MPTTLTARSLLRRNLGLLGRTVVGFWVLHLLYRWSIALIDGRPPDFIDPSLALALTFGFLLSIALCAILMRAAGRGLAFGLGMAVVLSLPVSILYATVEMGLYLQLSPEVNRTGSVRTMPDGTVVTATTSGEVTYRRPGEKRGTTIQLPPLKERAKAQAFRSIIGNATGWYFFYFGLASFFVGMSNAARLQQAERRVSEYERLAQDAQLRALRYQINPHFLFNTLNSLSALIMAGRGEQAEAMILNLSAFFRSSLAIEPTGDITLREEIALQRLYLDIESARFPNRLKVNVNVPEDAMDARVPALLLQPLVENAIKYGVALTEDMVRIRITAVRTRDAMLVLFVENNARITSSAPGVPGGTGVGLKNVRERLNARFGDAASCVAGFAEGGLFSVKIVLPLVLR